MNGVALKEGPEQAPAEMDAGALRDHLAAHIAGFDAALSVREFAGGGSNPTYMLSAADARWVVRTKPKGELAPGAHRIDREYRVMSALYEACYPVPRPLLYCNDDVVIGAEFYVMSFVEGRIFFDFGLPNMPIEDRSAVYDSMNDAIARLHRLDIDALGLSDFGKSTGFFDRQMTLWDRQYESAGMKLDRFEELGGWLHANLAIIEDRASLVHGDFTLLNVLIDDVRPQVAAVIDWELSTIGHPLADFAYHLLHWYMPSTRLHLGYRTLAEQDLARIGIPSMQDYTNDYARRVGIPITPEQLDIAIIFNLYRMAGIALGNVERAARGTAKNGVAATCMDMITPLLDLAWTRIRTIDS